MQDTTISVHSWKDFTKIVRPRGCSLLKRLDDFPEAVLVAGCQRSGTTILARVITQSEGMTNYWFGEDDELDAALILSGEVDHAPAGRYCFQTTYVDECYLEYTQHKGDFKIIWVIRNPYSVAYSLMYNWAPDALDGTFAKCAAGDLKGLEGFAYRRFGVNMISRVRRASYLYSAKTRQLFDLFKMLGRDRIFVVDYDELVMNRERILPQIYSFIKLDYNTEYCQQIHNKSVDKKSKLTSYETKVIRNIAEPVYHQALQLKNTHYPPLES